VGSAISPPFLLGNRTGTRLPSTPDALDIEPSASIITLTSNPERGRRRGPGQSGGVSTASARHHHLLWRFCREPSYGTVTLSPTATPYPAVLRTRGSVYQQRSVIGHFALIQVLGRSSGHYQPASVHARGMRVEAPWVARPMTRPSLWTLPQRVEMWPRILNKVVNKAYCSYKQSLGGDILSL